MTTAPTGTTDPAGTDHGDGAGRPPLSWLLAYRVLGLRLPERYRPWVARDVVSQFFLVWRMGRTFLWVLALVAMWWVGQTAVHQPPHPTMVMRVLFAGLALSLLSSGPSLVRRSLRWQRVDRHGRPVAPKGRAVLDNEHAVLLGVAGVVAFTAAMSLVFGFGQRSTGPAHARCRPADGDALRLIRGGLRDPRTKIEDAQQVTFKSTKMVAAIARGADGSASAQGVYWVIEGENVSELQTEANEPVTRFGPPTFRDRNAGDALFRLVQCLADARK